MAKADLTTQSTPSLLVDQQPDFEHVLACVFEIQPHEVRTYEALLGNPGSTVEALATALDRDRSNVNRSLATLRDRGLASRRRRLLDTGGHVYRYTATPREEVRERMHDTLDTWCSRVHDQIGEFPHIEETSGEG